MLGKRQRSQLMRRTTSMASIPPAPKQGRQVSSDGWHLPSSSVPAGVVGMGAVSGSPAPRMNYPYLAGVKTAAFLMVCGFCTNSLGPGKDTYIYRGEVAFCSEECRSKQIEEYELMEKNCSLMSIREAPSTGGSDGSSGDVVAAA